MPTIKYQAADGSLEEHDANTGSSIMQVAVMQGVRGIKADCGGACECATCHVYVDPAWLDRLPAMQAQEDSMLDSTAAPRLAHSRLSCQLVMDDALDGILVHLPEWQ